MIGVTKGEIAPKKVFILSDGEYTEVTYEELRRLTEENVQYADKLFIPLHGMLMEVTKDTYRDFYKDKRRQKYLYELSKENGEISYDMLTKDEFIGEDILIDSSKDIAAQVELKSAFPFIFRGEEINAEMFGNILFGYICNAGGFSSSVITGGGSLY